MESFFRDNPVLSQKILYDFEPCDNDKINKLCIEHNAALCLSKEARRWISCVAKEVRVIKDSKEELKKLLAQMGDKPPFTLQSDQIGPQAELEARIDELRQIIRRSQTSKKKAEARLEAMKEAGVNMEEWVRSSESDSVSVTEAPSEIFSRSGTVTSRSSRQSYQSEGFDGSVEVNDAAFYDSDTAEPANVSMEAESEAPYIPDITSAVDVVAAVQEAWDAAAETEEIEEPEPETVSVKENLVNGEVSAPAPGQRCVALFSYEATNSDELSFVEQEELELINDGDGDGWVMARNYRGEEGYIPQNYVEVVESQSTETTSRPPLTSFSSVDYTMPNEDKEAGIDVEGQPISKDVNTEKEVSELTSQEIQRPSDFPFDERVAVCQAIYDYEATCDEELSFFEGQIIKIIRKVVSDVDDGWWEGELDGQIGLFPSLVVEELKENGEPLTPLTPMSPPTAPPPPAFTPPEAELVIPVAQVILTQPTPEIETADGNVPQTSEENGKYIPLVSSPDTPAKTVPENVEDAKTETIAEEGTSTPSQGTDDCPTVVVTAITGGDTPVSDDDDMELKEKEEEVCVKETAPKEDPEEVPDKFECTFPDDDVFSNPPVPNNAQNQKDAKNEGQSCVDVEQIKMDINGSDSAKSAFDDAGQSSETTG